MNSIIKWLPLFSTNFFGVFNNNYFKFLIVTISVSWFSVQNTISAYIVSIASALFFVPYIFFSPLASKYSQIYYKKKLLVILRYFEIPVYVIGSIGFYFQNIYIVLTCIFLLGIIATIFSPAKYGLIRDIGGNKGISYGTGTIEMLTFFGNITGPIVASVISDNYNFLMLSVILIGVAIISLITTRIIKANEAKPESQNNESLNPLLFLINSFKWAKAYKGINLIVLALGVFWMVDGMLQMNLVVHCPNILKISNTQMSIVMSVALVGIGIGSYLAGVMSKGKIQLLFTIIGGACMSLFLLILFLINTKNVYLFTSFIFVIAFCSGIYMVPLSSYIQYKVEGRIQSKMISYSNFITFILLFAGSVIFGFISSWLGTNFVFIFLMIVMFTTILVLVLFVNEIKEKLFLFVKK